MILLDIHSSDAALHIYVLRAPLLSYEVLVAAVLDAYFAKARIRQVPASDTLLLRTHICKAAVRKENNRLRKKNTDPKIEDKRKIR